MGYDLPIRGEEVGLKSPCSFFYVFWGWLYPFRLTYNLLKKVVRNNLHVLFRISRSLGVFEPVRLLSPCPIFVSLLVFIHLHS